MNWGPIFEILRGPKFKVTSLVFTQKMRPLAVRPGTEGPCQWRKYGPVGSAAAGARQKEALRGLFSSHIGIWKLGAHFCDPARAEI